MEDEEDGMILKREPTHKECGGKNYPNRLHMARFGQILAQHRSHGVWAASGLPQPVLSCPGLLWANPRDAQGCPSVLLWIALGWPGLL